MPDNAYRSVTTGDKGFLVVVGGREYIELDRPSQVIRRLYKERDWIKEAEHRPLLPQQIGRIYYEAEKHLLIAVGDPEGRKMNWELMTNERRIDWMGKSSDHKLVKKLHKAMRKILEPLGK